MDMLHAHRVDIDENEHSIPTLPSPNTMVEDSANNEFNSLFMLMSSAEEARERELFKDSPANSSPTPIDNSVDPNAPLQHIREKWDQVRDLTSTILKRSKGASKQLFQVDLVNTVKQDVHSVLTLLDSIQTLIPQMDESLAQSRRMSSSSSSSSSKKRIESSSPQSSPCHSPPENSSPEIMATATTTTTTTTSAPKLHHSKKRKPPPASNANIKLQNLYCRSCGTTQTPEWRRGPDRLKSLCNACGLHYAKMMKREVLVPLRAVGSTPKQQMSVVSLLN
eukprot:TRINITY_DN5461_c0_g2_i1.p1 TRINITY_DN5461_c0_g2~~TRINITY_DN5461_c0_g2_i1.p1  ORF type:complete len:321 (+),score=78.44 TRINITY_DN5461_c0_g2_i1:129-965(+)